MMKRMITALLLTAALAVPAFAQANELEMKGQHPARDRSMAACGMDHMDQMAQMMGSCLEHAHKLGLTDEQSDKLAALHRTVQKGEVRAQADAKIAEMELMEIMEVKDFDFEKAKIAVLKIAEIRSTQHLEMLKTMKEVRNLLSDEQFAKMKQMMRSRMQMDEKKGKHAGKHK